MTAPKAGRRRHGSHRRQTRSKALLGLIVGVTLPVSLALGSLSAEAPVAFAASTGEDVSIGTSSWTLDGINVGRHANQLILYTRTVDQAVTPANIDGTDVVVIDGVVASIQDSPGFNGPGTPIPVGAEVLSGHGRARDWLISHARVGAIVTVRSGPVGDDGTSTVDPSTVDPSTVDPSTVDPTASESSSPETSAASGSPTSESSSGEPTTSIATSPGSVLSDSATARSTTDPTTSSDISSGGSSAAAPAAVSATTTDPTTAGSSDVSSSDPASADPTTADPTSATTSSTTTAPSTSTTSATSATPTSSSPTSAAPSPAATTGSWLSGESGTTSVQDGSFAAWRGRAVDIGGAWANTNSENDLIASAYWAMGPAGAYANTPNIDYAVGGPLQGETWSQAASGALDSRWTQQLRTMKAAWGSRPASNMYIRFAHEMNGNWFSWSVSPGDVGNYIAAWQRFYGLVQANFPGAKMVWCANAQSHQNYDVRSLWPGDGYVDVVGVDAYNRDPWVNTQDAFTTKINSIGSDGSPVGIEAWRQFAQAHGKPLAIPEWSSAAVDNGGGGGDAPVFMQLYHDWLSAHGGTGAGNVLYEVLFNVPGFGDHYELFQNGSSSGCEPQAAAVYKALW